MHEHERRLVEAAIAFVDSNPRDPDFFKTYETLVAARGEYQVVAVARLGDPTINDHGAFSANARPTSIRAAFTIPDRGSLRGKMLKLFATLSELNVGWADFELADYFQRDVRTIGSCRLDLLRTGWIQQTDEARYKSSDINEKRPCIVWEMTALGRQKYEELHADR